MEDLTKTYQFAELGDAAATQRRQQVAATLSDLHITHTHPTQDEAKSEPYMWPSAD